MGPGQHAARPAVRSQGPFHVAAAARTSKAIVSSPKHSPIARAQHHPPPPVGASAPFRYAGLVSEQAVGTRRIYHLNEAGLSALRDQLDTFWNRALSGFGDLASQPEEPQ
jgi:hypothetical protein